MFGCVCVCVRDLCVCVCVCVHVQACERIFWDGCRVRGMETETLDKVRGKTAYFAWLAVSEE
jgi:hypothetical protein